MAKKTRDNILSAAEFGHYHDKKKRRIVESQLGNEMIVRQDSFCSKCGKFTESKVLKRIKI